MGTTTIPIELYKILEDKLGKEQATEVVNLYEQTADALHTSVKISVKEELKEELATKSDLKAEIALVCQEMQTIKAELEGKIAKLDQKLNFLLVLMIIALTLMNPVVAEIIKGLLKL